MYEDLREQASVFDFEEEPPVEVHVRHEREFLGMTPLQRFVVALMLLAIVVLIGGFTLLVTEKVLLPI